MQSETTPSTVGRRALIRRALTASAAGAALQSVVAQPAGAQSAVCPTDVPDMAFTSSGGNGWTSTLVSGIPTVLSGRAGFIGNYRGVSPAHEVTFDALLGLTWDARKTICLEAGYQYTFTFSVAAFTQRAGWQLLDVSVDGTRLVRFSTDGGAGNPDVVLPNGGGQAYSRTFTPVATGDHVFRYRHTVGAGLACDDIGVGFPTVTRTAV